MAQDPVEALRIGQFWSRVSEEHDIEKFQTILAEDFVMWYNFSPTDRSRAQFLDTLRDAHAIFKNQINRDARITPTATGFVLQATLCGLLDGKEISAPYCMVAQIRDGKVIRGDEYFDTSQLPKRAGDAGEGMI
jgi:ketosteroid isomerase-like protein